jgi:hypothetical protein
MLINTRLIMTVSSLFLCLLGIVLSFLPNEMAVYMGMENSKIIQLVLQITGAQYFAMGMLNWMTKNSTIGGIYNRPVSIANFTHYMIGALALIKGLLSSPGLPVIFWILAVLYIVFAVVYGFIFNRNPVAA